MDELQWGGIYGARSIVVALRSHSSLYGRSAENLSDHVSVNGAELALQCPDGTPLVGREAGLILVISTTIQTCSFKMF